MSTWLFATAEGNPTTTTGVAANNNPGRLCHPVQEFSASNRTIDAVAATRGPRLAHPTPRSATTPRILLEDCGAAEERAERMGSIGSDLGEEIRKLDEQQKFRDSKRASSSLDAAPQSRNLSASYFAHSPFDGHSTAVQRDLSPSSSLSPITGSLRSGSWSQILHPMSVSTTSTSRSLPLGMSREARKELTRTAHRAAPENESSVQNALRSVPMSGSLIHHGISAAGISHTYQATAPAAAASFSDLADEEDTRHRRMRRLSTGRFPSNGSFTRLYHQIARENQQTTDVSGIRVTRDISFTDIYDQIAGEIKDQLDTSILNAEGRQTQGGRAESRTEQVHHSSNTRVVSILQDPVDAGNNADDCGPNFGSIDAPNQGQDGPLRVHVLDSEEAAVNRPSSASSQDTFKQAQVLFEDFDGIHYAPSIRSNVGGAQRRDELLASRPSSELGKPACLALAEANGVLTGPIAPPGDGMVFYPAPVPRLLNLPQRISQMPSTAMQAKRRTQMLSTLPNDARKSAPWLSQDALAGTSLDARTGRPNQASLPPQLRASIFFDPSDIRQDVLVKKQSAMKMLDDLLDISAQAPVGAFTDHPIVGKAAGNVYKKSAYVGNASSMDLITGKQSTQCSTESPGQHASQIFSDNSSASPAILGNTEDLPILNDCAPEERLDGETMSSATVDAEKGVFGRLKDGGSDAATREVGEVDVVETVPTTLLAELEMRKNQQKNRTRNAFNAFPDGMHATLLELDHIMKLENEKRRTKRVTLAWEDPNTRTTEEGFSEDEDVPLGVLYAGKEKTGKERMVDDWNRPLGLLEQKHLEDNEPLSRRRMRLLGVNPNAINNPPVQLTAPGGETQSESEHEEETLGQRMKRLRAKAVDDKSTDRRKNEDSKRSSSPTFSSELLSQFGLEASNVNEFKHGVGQMHSRNVSQGQVSTSSAPKSPGGGLLPPHRAAAPSSDDSSGGEETLAQRRARLQRGSVANVQGDMAFNINARAPSNFPTAGMESAMIPAPMRTPPLNPSRNLANLLAAYPGGKHDARKVSDDMLMSSLPQGSLLAQEAEKSAARKARVRQSSIDLLGPTIARPALDYRQMSNQARVNSEGGVAGMYINQQQMHGMWQQHLNSGTTSSNFLATQQHRPYPQGGRHDSGDRLPPINMIYPQAQVPRGRSVSGALHGHQNMMEVQSHDAFADNGVRKRVDTWRQSIYPP